MDVLRNVNSLIVSQKKEWGEILTGFETKNRYEIKDTLGNQLFSAHEIAGSILLRYFLKAYRPFTMNILFPNGNNALTLKRLFRFFLSRLNIFDASGRQIGFIKQHFSIFRRIYSVLSAEGGQVFRLVGPLLHPWTFNIIKDGGEIGKITKKWSGLGKEVFSDADNFSVFFPQDLDINQKSLLLGAVFLIDFVHFENKK